MEFIVTGAGSLPFEATEKALEVVNKFYYRLPFWPQLPKLDLGNGMLGQFLFSLKKLGLLNENNQLTTLVKDEKYLQLCCEKIQGLLDEDILPYAYASGLYDLVKMDWHESMGVKGQLTGLITLASFLFDANGNPAYKYPLFINLLVEVLKRVGLLQKNTLKVVHTNIIMIIDEPGLKVQNWQSIPESIRGQLIYYQKDIVDYYKNIGLKVGMHICAEGPWNQISSLGLDLINPDVWAIRDWQGFWQEVSNYKGVAWGLIPTKGPQDDNWSKISTMIGYLKQEYFKQKANKFNGRIIITPACGLAVATQGKTIQIIEKQCQAIEIWRENEMERNNGQL